MWQRSLGFIKTAPVIGHGTGSIPDQFRRTAVGEGCPDCTPTIRTVRFSRSRSRSIHRRRGPARDVARAPYAVYRRRARAVDRHRHRGAEHRLSQFNSHLFDSLHGWLYVFGFGVVGGMALRQQAGSSPAGATSEAP